MSKPKKSNKTKKKTTNPWMEHVKKVRKENKKLSFKDCLKKAKKSYKKK